MDKYQRYSKSEKGKVRRKKYKIKNTEKTKAQNKALYSFKFPQKCQIKGCEEDGERHHFDYKKTTDIIWLCRKHHNMIHGKVRGKCEICQNPSHAKGLCKSHYAQKYRKEQGW